MICDDCKFNNQDCVVKDMVVALNLQSCKFRAIQKTVELKNETFVVKWDAIEHTHSVPIQTT